MSKRKPHHEEHPDERWLITYADLLTLMFVLFMVLFSVASVNTTKFELLKQSLQSAFSITDLGGGGGESTIGDVQGPKASPVQDSTSHFIPQISAPASTADFAHSTTAQTLETTQLESAQERIDRALRRAGLADKVKTAVDQRGLTVRITTDDVLFGSGSAQLNPDAGSLLDPIATALRGLGNPVRVEGHTDSNPISTSVYPSNWELSGGRASAVVRYLESQGVPHGRLEVAGYGDTTPIADNESDAGRAINRRVEILVVRMQGTPGQGTGNP